MVSRYLFFDESGNTGQKLIDEAQPSYSLASHAFSDSRSEQVLNEYFGDSQADELKYSSLKKSARYRDRLLDLLSGPLADELESIFVFFADKIYSLVIKFFEFTSENKMDSLQMNFYQDGYHVAVANAAYYSLAQEPGKLASFAEAAYAILRNREVRKYPVVCSLLSRTGGLKNAPPDYLMLSRDEAKNYIPSIPEDALDLVPAGMLRSLEQWRARSTSEETLIVHHDESTLVEKSQPFIEYLGDGSRQHIRAKTGPKLADVQYPLKLQNIEFVRSEHSASVQLADIIAGFMNEYAQGGYAGKPAADEFVRGLEEAQGLHAVIPIPETDPDALGTRGTDARRTLNYFTSQLLQRS